eukprot:CAMPEP_0177602754 /NCGR_PEP_ID=MMETSP0419_2-20121207/15075_1 /TAXON_ID=582737 /ORGANISM="Tetraselmis sp., Strain GSL018" /LENGTH=402 /DNA_ID=CAMNT_0019096335 /DNA_START=325 /DNA_END=1533 /DNA_ORIENTATION=-
MVQQQSSSTNRKNFSLGKFSTVGSPVLCRALVAFGSRELPRICEVTVGVPLDGEVRVRMLCASICPTDTEAAVATEPSGFRFPCVLGHEGAGVVESVGPGVKSVKSGDYVIPCFLPFCGRCSLCKSGKTNLCDSGKQTTRLGLMQDGSTRFRLSGSDQQVFHFLGTSTLSEFSVIHEHHLAKVSKRAPPDRVCLLSCTVPCGLGAVFNTAQVVEGSTSAVFGLSLVGLAVIEALRLSNARRIIAIDIDDEKLSIARGWGATDCVNPGNCSGELPRVIQELSNGGVDYSFDCVGTSSVSRAALDCCHSGWGLATLVGCGGSTSSQLPFDQGQALSGKAWKGSIFGGYKSRAEIPVLVERYLSGEIMLNRFQVNRISLSSFAQGFSLVREGKCTAHQVVVFHQS